MAPANPRVAFSQRGALLLFRCGDVRTAPHVAVTPHTSATTAARVEGCGPESTGWTARQPKKECRSNRTRNSRNCQGRRGVARPTASDTGLSGGAEGVGGLARPGSGGSTRTRRVWVSSRITPPPTRTTTKTPLPPVLVTFEKIRRGGGCIERTSIYGICGETTVQRGELLAFGGTGWAGTRPGGDSSRACHLLRYEGECNRIITKGAQQVGGTDLEELSLV